MKLLGERRIFFRYHLKTLNTDLGTLSQGLSRHEIFVDFHIEHSASLPFIGRCEVVPPKRNLPFCFLYSYNSLLFSSTKVSRLR